MGIGIGTFFSNCIFIFGGKLIAQQISRNQNILNRVIGGIFLGTAIFQEWQMIRKRRVARNSSLAK